MSAGPMREELKPALSLPLSSSKKKREGGIKHLSARLTSSPCYIRPDRSSSYEAWLRDLYSLLLWPAGRHVHAEMPRTSLYLSALLLLHLPRQQNFSWYWFPRD